MNIYTLKHYPDGRRTPVNSEFTCSDDDSALQRLNGYSMEGFLEIWQGDRLLKLIYRPERKDLH